MTHGHKPTSPSMTSTSIIAGLLPPSFTLAGQIPLSSIATVGSGGLPLSTVMDNNRIRSSSIIGRSTTTVNNIGVVTVRSPQMHPITPLVIPSNTNNLTDKTTTTSSTTTISESSVNGVTSPATDAPSGILSAFAHLDAGMWYIEEGGEVL